MLPDGLLGLLVRTEAVGREAQEEQVVGTGVPTSFNGMISFSPGIPSNIASATFLVFPVDDEYATKVFMIEVSPGEGMRRWKHNHFCL